MLPSKNGMIMWVSNDMLPLHTLSLVLKLCLLLRFGSKNFLRVCKQRMPSMGPKTGGNVPGMMSTSMEIFDSTSKGDSIQTGTEATSYRPSYLNESLQHIIPLALLLKITIQSNEVNLKVNQNFNQTNALSH